MKKNATRFRNDLSAAEMEIVKIFFSITDDVEGTIYLKEFVSLYDSKKSLEKIAEELEESVSTLSRHLKKIKEFLNSLCEKL